jgi:hypothetical protein
MRAEKKWLLPPRRAEPTWIKNLLHVDRWLRE